MGGGSKTTSVAMPAWLEDAAKYSLGRAEQASKVGYTPYYGPDVAAMTPMQVAAMQGTNTAAGAFGIGTADPMAGMPQAQNFNGMAAYSSGPMYDQALAELQRRQPGQYNALRAPFIDPITGAQPGASSMQGKSGSGTAVPAPSPVVAPVERGGRGAELAAERAAASAGGGGGRSTTSMATPASYMPGGVNTRNPSSAVNQMAAALTSKPAGPTAPISSPVPVSRSTAASTASQAASAKAAADAKAAASKAAASKAAADKAAASKAAADKAAASKAAADKAKAGAAQGKGGNSAAGGGKSSGGSLGGSASRR